MSTVRLASGTLSALPMLKRLLITAAMAGVACGAPSANTPAAPSREKHAGRVEAEPFQPRAVLRLTSDEKTEARVNADLRFEGAIASATSLRFAPTHGARLEGLVVRDEQGIVQTTDTVEAAGTRIELARRPRRELAVSYSVILDPAADDTGGFAEPIEFRGGGEDLLVLPEVADDPPIPIEIHLRAGGANGSAASSFGLGSEQRASARISDLRHGYYLAGDVGTAIFHASDGDDIGGWLGHTAFDPRWVSAEAVGIRSAVDAWVGRNASSSAPPLAFLFSATKRNDPPIAVIPRTRGLLVSVDRRAGWNAPARILVGQALTKRYLGGFLWIGERNDEASGRIFSDGFSRTIAREVLFDANLLDPLERAAEVNRLLSAFTFAEDASRKATANGALVATALDAALRSKKTDLRSFVRELLAHAATAKRSELGRDELMTRIRERTTEETARDLSRAIDHGDEVALPVDLMGPCFRLAKKRLVRFELGFATSAGEEMVVTSVKPGSRAEAAGLHVGDVVAHLRYESGNARVPVELVLKRKGKDEREKTLEVRFLPVGESKSGRVFERLPGIADDRC